MQVDPAIVRARARIQLARLGPGFGVGLGAGGVAASSPAFSPLARGASLLAWYRSDLGITNISGKASAWADQSGRADSNRNLIQPTAGSRPTIVASNATFGGRPTLRFSGADPDSLLPTGNWSTAITQPVTVYSVQATSSVATQDTYYSDGVTNLKFQLYQTAGAGLIAYAGTANVGSGEAVLNTARVVCTIFDGASSAMYDTQLTASATGNMGTNGAVSLLLGNSATLGSGLTGDLAEVAVLSGHDNATQRAQMMGYLGALYGVTIGS